MSMRSSFRIALALSVGLGASAPKLAAAADWYVPGDSPTVTGALALASAGDRVYVGPGTYFERITVPAGVHLYGAGPEVSILDGSSAGTVVQVGGDDVVISGFSIRNAGGAYPDFGVSAVNAGVTACGNLIYWNFRGVWIEGASDSSVLWNISADNEDDGLDGVNATAIFRGNTVVSNGNAAIADGDIGIYLLSVEVRTISENIVAHDNEFGIWCDGLTDSAHNDVYDHQSNFTSCGSSASDFSLDPLFVSWSDDNDPRNDDFHLQAGSPCRDVIASPPYDHDGSDRDLGAYGGQGYEGGPRSTWQLYGEVDQTTVTPGSPVTLTLAAMPDMIACDHGVDRLELGLPGFLSGLSVSGVEISGNPVAYSVSGGGALQTIALSDVLGAATPILVTLGGDIPADATGQQTIGLRAGIAFINAWTLGAAGDADSGGPIATMSLTITATPEVPDGGPGGAGGGGAGPGGSGTGAGGAGAGAGGTGTGGSGHGASSSGGNAAADSTETGSCGCRVVASGPARDGGAAFGAWVGVLGLVARRRRRR
jgi:hypothetical protein